MGQPVDDEPNVHIELRDKIKNPSTRGKSISSWFSVEYH